MSNPDPLLKAIGLAWSIRDRRPRPPTKKSIESLLDCVDELAKKETAVNALETTVKVWSPVVKANAELTEETKNGASSVKLGWLEYDLIQECLPELRERTGVLDLTAERTSQTNYPGPCRRRPSRSRTFRSEEVNAVQV